MKKHFTLKHPKHKYARMVEAARGTVNRFLKKERQKKLPKGYHYWDFDCRYGSSEEDAVRIHVEEISKSISEVEARQQEAFFLEIIPRAAKRNAQPDKPNPASKN